MSGWKPVTAADIRYTAKRMGKGVSLRACARERGVSSHTLRKRMVAEGLPTRRSILPPRRNGFIDYPPTKRTMMVVRMVKKHGTQVEAARRLGISRQAVNLQVRRYNIHV